MIRQARFLPPCFALAVCLACSSSASEDETRPPEPAPQPGPATDVTEPDPLAGSGTQPRPLRVIMEVDRMLGTPALVDVQTLDEREVSLAKIYREAGVQLEIVPSDADLPRAESVTLGDLHGLMVAHRDPTLDADLEVYCLMATRLLGAPGEPETLGIMFDFGENDANDIPREAFAVFADAHTGGTQTPEILLTTAHELAHCFNIHHNDWEGESFRRASTVESYCSTSTVIWALSGQSKRHIAGHPLEEVRWGRGSLPFSFITQDHSTGHQEVPFHRYEVVRLDDPSARSRDALHEQSAAVRVEGSAARLAETELVLELRAQRETYQLGEPVVIDAVLRNAGAEAVKTSGLLDPMYGFLSLTWAPANGSLRLYHPPVHGNARAETARVLEPGAEIAAPCRVFFGSGGWTFDAAGRYTLQARYYDDGGARARLIDSEPLEITVVDGSDASRRSAELTLDKETGLFLYMNGGAHLKQAVENLETLAARDEDVPHVDSAKLALAVSALETSTDPGAKQSRVEVAQKYLDGILDSQLADRDIIYAQQLLATELDNTGQTEQAQQVRIETIEKYWDSAEPLDAETLKKADLRRILEQTRAPELRKEAVKEYGRVK
jgi:hypothetical protein